MKSTAINTTNITHEESVAEAHTCINEYNMSLWEKILHFCLSLDRHCWPHKDQTAKIQTKGCFDLLWAAAVSVKLQKLTGDLSPPGFHLKSKNLPSANAFCGSLQIVSRKTTSGKSGVTRSHLSCSKTIIRCESFTGQWFGPNSCS